MEYIIFKGVHFCYVYVNIHKIHLGHSCRFTLLKINMNDLSWYGKIVGTCVDSIFLIYISASILM